MKASNRDFKEIASKIHNLRVKLGEDCNPEIDDFVVDIARILAKSNPAFNFQIFVEHCEGEK